ncbi:MAG: hypothetical protein L0K86_23710, partial [Actinomycetia bacterium]|nr:hypothetical protein [Actinomycetes bacterium]
VTIHRLAILPGVTAEKARRRRPRPDELCCLACRRGVRAEPAGYWRMGRRPRPGLVTPDGRALCRIATDDGDRITEPVQRTQARPVQAVRAHPGPMATSRVHVVLASREQIRRHRRRRDQVVRSVASSLRVASAVAD